MDITLADHGHGRPYLLLHGGAGPRSVMAFAEDLAADARVLVPTHPGFGGTTRPEDLTTIRALAAGYRDLLDERDLTDVTVIGNSIGGWLAAELALLDSPRVRAVVLVDAVGIEVPGHPVADFFSLTFPELAQLSYHDPDRFLIDPTAMSPAEQQEMAGNRATLAVYASTMSDPTLRERLAAITVPTLVVWGESDGIADADYGRAYAEAIPTAEFRLLTGTGHLPQLENPAALRAAVEEFASARVG